MFETEAKEYRTHFENELYLFTNTDIFPNDIEEAYQKGAEATLRKVVKYFSTRALDEFCGGYFSRLLESEEKLQELAKELENV